MPSLIGTLTKAAFLAFPYLASAITLDCSQIHIRSWNYDLYALRGPHSVQSYTKTTPPSISNITFTVDVCGVLGKDSSLPDDEQCPNGARVCGVEHEYNSIENISFVSRVIPIAGNFIHDNKYLDPRWERMHDSASSADADKEGIRLEMNGGKYPFRGKSGKLQKAFIEFLCDPERTGNEGYEDGEKDENDAASEEATSGTIDVRIKENDDQKEPEKDPNEGKSLKFVSYEQDADGKTEILRLKWFTKYACEGMANSQPARSGHWGFFTWFIIILFLAVATYLVFGSWLNYNRYGSRGLDLLPHGETIRDIPYLLKDWARKVVNTFSGDSRGGYSAV